MTVRSRPDAGTSPDHPDTASALPTMEESALKVKIAHSEVLGMLKRDFDSRTRRLAPIGEGESSRAYSFLVGDRAYIVRLNSHQHGFEKDKYAQEHFDMSALPIPRTVQIGHVRDGLHYSITERSEGVLLSSVGRMKKITLLPKVYDTLAAMRGIEITSGGYGRWDSKGRGSKPSWKESLEELSNRLNREPHEGDMQIVIDGIIPLYLDLIDYCPESSSLIHGDFGGNNLLTNGAAVSGVIDWANAMYGDFLYDVARASVWDPDIDCEVMREYYSKISKGSLENFDERILCYRLHGGLETLSWFAVTGQRRKFAWARGKLDHAIDQAVRRGWQSKRIDSKKSLVRKAGEEQHAISVLGANAESARESRDWKQAALLYKQLVEREPSFPNSYRHAESVLFAGDAEAAAPLIEQLAALPTSDAAAVTMLRADFAEHVGDHAASERLRREALRLGAWAYWALYGQARSLARLGRLGEAREVMERALACPEVEQSGLRFALQLGIDACDAKRMASQ